MSKRQLTVLVLMTSLILLAAGTLCAAAADDAETVSGGGSGTGPDSVRSAETLVTAEIAVPGDDDTDDPGDDDADEAEGADAADDQHKPRTGDDNRITFFIVLLASSAIILGIMIIRILRRRN